MAGPVATVHFIEPASERRPRLRGHLPLKDVAEAGGWRSTETLLRCYTQADEATMLAGVSETRKVREAGKP